MPLVAILAALVEVMITLYWTLIIGHRSPLYVLAAVCAVILLILLIVPVIPSRRLDP